MLRIKSIRFRRDVKEHVRLGMAMNAQKSRREMGGEGVVSVGIDSMFETIKRRLVKKYRGG